MLILLDFIPLPVRVTATLLSTTTRPSQSTASQPSPVPPKSTPPSTPTATRAQQPTPKPTATHHQAKRTPHHTCRLRVVLSPRRRQKMLSPLLAIRASRPRRSPTPEVIILISLLRRSSDQARSLRLRGRRIVCSI